MSKKGIVSLIFLSILLGGCTTNETKAKSQETSRSSLNDSSQKSSQSSKTSTSSTIQSKDSTDIVKEITQETQTNQEHSGIEQEKTLDDWKIKFEQTLYENYKVTVKNYVDNGDDTYGVFVKEIDTGDQPYVTVNSVTGNFHG